MKELTLSQEPDGTWIARSERIPGYAARGSSPEDAIASMKKAFSLWFPCGECKGSDEP